MSAWKWRPSVMVGGIGLSAALFVCVPSVAAAGIVTETFSFTASGLFNPPGGPADVQTGSFTLTFDPTLTYIDAPLDAISLTIVGHTYSLSDSGFAANPPDGPSGQLAFGGLLNGVIFVGSGGKTSRWVAASMPVGTQFRALGASSMHRPVFPT